MSSIITEIHGVRWELVVSPTNSVIVYRSEQCLNHRKAGVGFWDGDKLVIQKWLMPEFGVPELQKLTSVLRVCLAD